MSRLRPIRKSSPPPDGAWNAEDPFSSPRISTFPTGSIRRLRNTLFKLTPAASAEREALKKINQYKIPLTERNIGNFVLEQQLRDTSLSERHSTELQVSAWLDKLL